MSEETMHDVRRKKQEQTTALRHHKPTMSLLFIILMEHINDRMKQRE